VTSHFKYLAVFSKITAGFSYTLPVKMAGTTTSFFTEFFVGPPAKLARFENQVTLNAPTINFTKQLNDLQAEVKRLSRELDSARQKLADAAKSNIDLKSQLLKETRPFYNSKKKFSELDRFRKSHKKQEMIKWFNYQFDKLPSGWKVNEVCTSC